MIVNFNSSEMLKEARLVLKEIEAIGFQAVIAGGAVRDILLGQEPHDIDIATNMSMPFLEKLFTCHDIGKSKDFGLVVVRRGEFSFEIAQFRSDGKYSDGRRPDSVEFVSSFKEDAARRDFTINAMGIQSNGTILDFFNGQQDLAEGLIRTVGEPEQRFEEDKLRMLRAFRFAAKLNFTIDPVTMIAIKDMASTINAVSPERIRDELCKMAVTGRFYSALIGMWTTHLLDHILPEVSNLQFVDQKDIVRGIHLEGDAFNHTVFTVKHSPPTLILQLSALFHDVGKALTRTVNEKGHIQFLEHDEKSVEMTEVIMKRLKFDSETMQKVLVLVKNHMRFHCIGEHASVKVIRRVIREIGPELTSALLDLAEADCISCLPKENYVPKLREKVQKVFDSPMPVRRKAILSGREIMILLSIPQGPEIGRIQQILIELEDDLAEKDEVLTPKMAEDFLREGKHVIG